MILPELAHAWTYENVDEETKSRFLETRGLRSWRDESIPGEERGFEQVAEMIAWSLMDKERMIRTLSDLEPIEITRAYRLLTSSPPPPR